MNGDPAAPWPGFSANLGFLWRELSLPDAIGAAARAGFAAVECHWPYDTPTDAVRTALARTGIPMLGLNTVRGDPKAGEFGLAALTGREGQARAAIDQALDYAAAVGARHVHVMAGIAHGPAATRTYAASLAHACDRAADMDLGILIEPLNPHDVPGYFLRDTAQAAEIIHTLGRPNLRLMFDCYHVARTEGDVVGRLRALRPILGHIQFAAVPDRGPPDHGDLDYTAVFSAIAGLGWPTPVGAEYIVDGSTEATLGWMTSS